MTDYAAIRKLVARLKAAGMLSDAVAGQPSSQEGHSCETGGPPPVAFPAITEAEVFWGIGKRVVRRQPGGGTSGPDH